MISKQYHKTQSQHGQQPLGCPLLRQSHTTRRQCRFALLIRRYTYVQKKIHPPAHQPRPLARPQRLVTRRIAQPKRTNRIRLARSRAPT